MKGKRIAPDDQYILDIVDLRKQGYTWTAIAKHFNKHHTTIMYLWKKHMGRYPVIKDKKLNVSQRNVPFPSWNGEKHLCCNSFLKKKHFTSCPNMAGNWHIPGPHLDDKPALKVNKYDALFDEKMNIGRSYQQYFLK